MPFPLGGDFTRGVNNAFTIIKSDRRICKHDNGTNVCELGHKLKFPGTCTSQQVGTFNSTDATFQPTFPICVSDYESIGFSGGVLFSKSLPQSTHFVEEVPEGATRAHDLHSFSNVIQAVRDSYNFAISKQGSGVVSSLSAQVTGSFISQVVPFAATTFWRMAQFNPGDLPHLPGIFSDLFRYDVVSSYNMVNRVVIHMLESVAAKMKLAAPVDMAKNLVTTDYYTTISGSTDPCVGDEEPPFITLFSPTASGIQVRPQNQIIDFSLTDAVGGVDISTVYIDLNSTTTSGTIPLVVAGADQTSGAMSITGDATSYRFTYTHPSLWEYNDIVTTTISGSDLPPMVNGNPFFCGPSAVNTFLGDIPFQVLNKVELSAQITVVGDVSPPYIDFSSPASGTIGNSVFSPVIIHLADDLTGVDLSSLIVSIDGTLLVQNGVPTTSEIIITGAPGLYSIVYTPISAFAYNSTSTLQISADDRVVSPSPNSFSSSYDFSFIEDSTLIIENFLPAVGTHHNLDQLDIVVDVRDDTFGVDSDQTFFVINGTIISGTQSVLTSGIQMRYHPPNDFAYDEPIRVTVHGTNNNVSAPVVKESFFNLFYGCRVVVINDKPYLHGEHVDVFVRARNTESLHKDLSTGYFFTAYTQPQTDIGASIFAINPVLDLSASLDVVAPEHRYGETIEVEFTVEDFDGHILGPFTFTYTIEDRPD